MYGLCMRSVHSNIPYAMHELKWRTRKLTKI